MIALVTGGASSGKSAFAERLALALPAPRAYVATMRHGDAETEARIARHRRMRADKGFATVELGGEAAAVELDGDFAAAVELSGDPEAFGKDGNPAAVELVDNPATVELGGDPEAVGEGSRTGQGERSLLAGGFGTVLLEDLGNLVANGLEEALADVLACGNVVIVANEVGCDGAAYDAFTMGYIGRLGALACELAARADTVVEVVAGVPVVVKGALPWAC